MDISLDIKFPGMKLVTDDDKIHVKGSMSQNFELGLSLFFYVKKRETFCEFFKLYFLNFY